ncbi:hypothetical protein BXA19_12230, partial [Corynebacterium diphtheriae]
SVEFELGHWFLWFFVAPPSNKKNWLTYFDKDENNGTIRILPSVEFELGHWFLWFFVAPPSNKKNWLTYFDKDE